MYKLLECKRCKGSGKEPIDLFFAIFTVGLSYLASQNDPCAICRGSGLYKYEIKGD